MIKLRTGLLVFGGLGTALVFSALALAGVATSVSAYGGEAGRAQASVAGAAGAANASNLPFTGTNLGLIVLAGIVLLAAGLILRRRARSTS